jgi:hypothetical protein
VLHGRKELWAKDLKISSILQEFDAREGGMEINWTKRAKNDEALHIKRKEISHVP